MKGDNAGTQGIWTKDRTMRTNDFIFFSLRSSLLAEYTVCIDSAQKSTVCCWEKKPRRASVQETGGIWVGGRE